MAHGLALAILECPGVQMAAEVASSLARYCGLREEQWSASCELLELLSLFKDLSLFVYLCVCPTWIWCQWRPWIT